MIGLKRLALLKHGAPPRNVLEAALRAKWGGGGASYEKTVGPAPIISISDAKAKPAKSLIVGMEPIQDLHGYDSPWPAGGGKNLCPPFVPTSGTGLTVTANSDGSLSVSGTATASGYITEFATLAQTIPSGTTFVISIKNAVTTRIRTFFDQGVSDIYEGSTSSAPITNSADVTKVRLYLFLTEGAAYNFTIYFQLELGSTVTSWSPYSNICPISGRTGVTAWRTGVNVWDEQWEVGGLNTSNGANWNTNTRIRSKNYIQIKPSVGYYISYPTSGVSVDYCFYDANKEFISSSGGANKVVTSPSNAYFLRFATFSQYGTTYNHDISINYPSTNTDYHAYTGESYPVTWQDEAGTVYGGTVDVVSGVLTVTDAEIASYNGETLPSTWISDRDVYAEGTTPTIGAQVVYELATPQTYQLTPQQIQLLKGSNTLWSDGDSLTLTYIGTQPAGLLGGGFGGVYTPPEEEPEEEEQVPEEEQAEESDPEEVIPDGE